MSSLVTSRNPQPLDCVKSPLKFSKTMDELAKPLMIYANSLHNLPSISDCRAARETAMAALNAAPLASQAALKAAAGLLDALPRQSGDDGATDAKIATLASALREYPAPVATAAVASIVRTSRWAPAPVHVHESADETVRNLRAIVANADKAMRHIADMKAEADRPQRPDRDRRAEIVALAMQAFKREAV